MAEYILCNRVLYDGQDLKSAKEIDDTVYSLVKLAQAGAVLIQLPNPEIEAWAARVRHEQIKGIGSWLTSEELSAAFIKASSGATSKILDVKLSCRLGTTANIVLSGLQVIDGIMTAVNDRVFVKDQGVGAANGLYLAKTGAWVRTDDANVSDSVTTGLFSFIEEGTTLADTGWILTTIMPIVLDTTPLVFTQFSGAGAGVPPTRNLTAGAGLTGGGNLSADRTFDVVANADASIVVNANDVQVGVLATDAQHGVRGGGTQHAAVVPAGAAGFMTGADKTKLDGLPASAVSPTRTLTAGTGMTGGGDLSADRTFDVVGNADGSIVANANDVQVGVLATDAQHGVRGGGTQHANATGAVAGFMTAADFTKLGGVAAGATNTPLTAVAPVNVTKAAAVVGVSTDAARSDHKHDVTTAVVGSIAVGDAAAEGAATSLARSDHTHALTAPAAPADVTKAAASAGAATTVARSDHKHDVSTAAPVDIGSANAEGAATSLARSNHVHNLTSAVAKAAAASGFTAGSVPFVIAGPTLSEDNAAFFWNATNDQLGVGTNTFTNVREKVRMAKPAGDAYARFDGAMAAGVTDSSGTPNLLSASPFLCFVVGSQLDSDQFGFGNAGLYACARTGAGAGNPPTLAPFTGLSCSDNGALVTLGDPGGGRSVYVGGGGWGAPAANDFTVWTAPTYTETADTDVLRMHINALGTVNHCFAMRETGIISPAGIGGGTTNNYNPTDLQQSRTIRQSVTAAHVLTGLTAPSLAGQTDGTRIRIINIATNIAFTLTLNHQDAGSTAANRFINPAGVALVVAAGGCIELMYDATSTRWRPVSIT